MYENTEMFELTFDFFIKNCMCIDVAAVVVGCAVEDEPQSDQQRVPGDACDPDDLGSNSTDPGHG